jgi:hypothetical protein
MLDNKNKPSLIKELHEQSNYLQEKLNSIRAEFDVFVYEVDVVTIEQDSLTVHHQMVMDSFSVGRARKDWEVIRKNWLQYAKTTNDAKQKAVFVKNAELAFVEPYFNSDKLLPMILDSIFIDTNIQSDIRDENWFNSFVIALFHPPYGTTLRNGSLSEQMSFLDHLCRESMLLETDCEVIDWVGCSGSGRDDCSDWSDAFEAGREWWGNWCLTIYSPSRKIGSILIASATD